MDGDPYRVDRAGGLHRAAKSRRVDGSVRLQANLPRAQHEWPGTFAHTRGCRSPRENVIDGELETTDVPGPTEQPVGQLGTERDAGSHIPA